MSASSTQSATEVCNQALSLISVEQINSIEDSGASARQCKQFYGWALDMVLRKVQPAEAIATASLAADGSYTPDATYQFAYRYRLPEDPYCLVVQRVNDLLLANVTTAGTVELNGRALLTNTEAPLFLRYVARVSDISLLPPEVVECIAYQVAIKLSYIKHADSRAQRELMLQYREFIEPAAIAHRNSILGQLEPIHESEFLRSYTPSGQPTIDTSHLGDDPTQ